MLQIIINDADVKRALTKLRSRTEDMKPAFEDIGQYYTKRIDTQFRDERDPYGTPWAALKPRTIKQKQKDRRILKILQSTGLLRGSFSYTADRSSVEIGSNRVTRNGIPLGILHQLGSRRGLPARPILPTPQRGLPPADSQEIVAILEDHITGVWSKGFDSQI